MVAVGLFVTGAAQAQAPPPAYFVGRSHEELRALAADPANDVLLRRAAATKLVVDLADAGDVDAADAAGREFARNVDPRALAHAAAVRRRLLVHPFAVAALLVPLALAAVGLATGRRKLRGSAPPLRRLAPVAGVFLLQTGLVGAWLATRYENGSPVPFVVFAACLAPLLATFRAWGAVGSRRVEARAARGVLAALAVVALGFLVVERVNPAYLAGFGL